MLSETIVLEVAQQAIWTMIMAGTPIMLVALVVGLAISLLQALTQVQEMTLTFVPKILAMLLAMIVAMPFMLHTLVQFTEELYLRIGGGAVGT